MLQHFGFPGCPLDRACMNKLNCGSSSVLHVHLEKKTKSWGGKHLFAGDGSALSKCVSIVCLKLFFSLFKILYSLCIQNKKLGPLYLKM